jgi:hypothetical protein
MVHEISTLVFITSTALFIVLTTKLRFITFFKNFFRKKIPVSSYLISFKNLTLSRISSHAFQKNIGYTLNYVPDCNKY